MCVTLQWHYALLIAVEEQYLGHVNSTLEKYENAALFLRSKLIRHANGHFKDALQTEEIRNRLVFEFLRRRTPLRFSVDET